MSDTSVPVAAPEAAPAPLPEVAPAPEPVETPPADVQVSEEEAPPAPAWTLPESYEELEAALPESLRSEHDARLEETRKKAYSEGQARAQPIFERAQRTSQQYLETAQKALGYQQAFFETVQKARDEGSLDDTVVARAIAQYAPQYASLMGGLEREFGWYTGAVDMAVIAAEVAGDAGIGETFTSRWMNAQATAASPEEKKMIMQDLIDAVSAEREKKAEERGYKRGLKDNGTAGSVAAKAKARDGAGPDMAQAVGGGGISLAEAERRYTLPVSHPERITHEQYKAIRKRDGVK